MKGIRRPAIPQHLTRAILTALGACPFVAFGGAVWLATFALDSILVALIVVMTMLLPILSSLGTLSSPRRR
jgi:hypothetical protein